MPAASAQLAQAVESDPSPCRASSGGTPRRGGRQSLLPAARQPTPKRCRRRRQLPSAGAQGSAGAEPQGGFPGLADVSISEDIPVEGEITVPVGSRSPDEDYSTLDEPVRDTIMRDLKAVGKKFVHVMYPKKSSALLRDWDLWGPLVLCVSLALMLQGGSADSKDDGGPQFAEVFVIIWFGAVVITLNSKLLGGTISFFQSLCVLGYCVLPLTVAMLVCRLVLLAGSGTVSFVIRLIVVVAMFGWSTLASTAFLADSQPPNRKALVVYPIFLFYFVISWMILTFTPQ
ncbi:PREDICTED: protein YIPF6 [Aptenodytes forsteri]|nr:PREDICTED: protein YIPF6 [Aptenodytes forsteri]